MYVYNIYIYMNGCVFVCVFVCMYMSIFVYEYMYIRSVCEKIYRTCASPKS